MGEIAAIYDFSCRSLLMEYIINLKNDYYVDIYLLIQKVFHEPFSKKAGYTTT